MKRLVVVLAFFVLLDLQAAHATPFLGTESGQPCVNADHNEEILVATPTQGVRLFTTDRGWIPDIRSIELGALNRAFGLFIPGLLGVTPHNLTQGRPLDFVVISPAGVSYQAATDAVCGEPDSRFSGVSLTHRSTAEYRQQTVFHELFHVLQRSLNAEHANSWWWGEASAEWAGWSLATSPPGDARDAAEDQFLRNPGFPLDRYAFGAGGLEENHAYAAALFVDWLEVRYSDARFNRFLRASLASPRGTATVEAAIRGLTGRSIGSNLAEFWAGAVMRPQTPVAMTPAMIDGQGTSLARAVEPLAAHIVDLAPRSTGFHLRVPAATGQRARLHTWIVYGPESHPTMWQVDPGGEDLYFCPAGSDQPDSEPIPPYLRVIVVNGQLTGGARALDGARAEPDDCQADPPEPANCPQNIDLAVRNGMTNGRSVESVDLNNDGFISDEEQIERNSYTEPAIGPLCHPPQPGAQVCSRAPRLPRSLTLDMGARLGGVRFGMTKRQVCTRWGRPAVKVGETWYWGQDVPSPGELEPYLRARTKVSYIISYCRYGPFLLPPEQRAGLRPNCRENDRLAAFHSSGSLGRMLELNPPVSRDWVEATFSNGKLWLIASWRARDRARSGLRPGSTTSEVSRSLGQSACARSGPAIYCTARGGQAQSRCEIGLTTTPMLYVTPVHPHPPHLGTRVRTLSIRGVGRQACAPRE